MRYSLLSRFQGVLLGAALGDAWGLSVDYSFRERNGPRNPAIALGKSWGALDLPPTANDQLAWGKLGLQVSSASGSAIALQQIFNSPASPETLGETPHNSTELALGMAIATLPLLLLGHEQPERWQTPLQNCCQSWQVPEALALYAEVLGFLFAHILAERFHPNTALDTLLHDLHQFSPERATDELSGAIASLQLALQQGISLSTFLQAQSERSPLPSDLLSPLPLTHGLYCFLSSPNSFERSVLRASRVGHPTRLLCAFVGALSGAFNGIAGLPAAGLNWLDSPVVRRTFLEPLWDAASVQILKQQAATQFHQWAGATPSACASGLPLAIAPPRVIGVGS